MNRWQEYTELYKKDLHDIDNHNGLITHLQLDILECQVKWTLGSITANKTSGGDGIPVELFQILKDDAMKVLHSICHQIWKTRSGHRTGKCQFSFQSQGKAMPKNAQTTTQLHSTDMLIMLKILQVRLQQHMNRELPDVQTGFRKGRGTRDQLPTSVGSLKKQGSSVKTSTSALLTMPKPLPVWITTNWKIFRDGDDRSADLPLEKSVHRSGSNS